MRGSRIALLVLVSFLVIPPAYSTPSAERPVTRQYILSPSVLERVLRAARITPRSRTRIDLRPYFESQGVVFDGDCAVTLNPATRIFRVTNTSAQRELIELIFEHVLHARIKSPNHALQRTGSAVTAPAADHHHLSTHRQVPRPLRLSLSLGSFGDIERLLRE